MCSEILSHARIYHAVLDIWGRRHKLVRFCPDMRPKNVRLVSDLSGHLGFSSAPSAGRQIARDVIA